MKICFLWYFDKASQVYDNWRDGLRSAIELIGKEHKVHWVIGQEFPEDDYDAILFWTDSNSSFFDRIDKYKGKKGLFLTTDPQNFDNLRKLDVVYCESKPIYDAVRQQGIHAVKAFGTDTDFFKPKKVKKDIEYFYPATFSPWKRQDGLVYLGKKLTLLGTVQPDGKEILRKCQKAGVNCIVDYVSADKLKNYYDRARHVVINANHGSERTVLESMSMNILPEVLDEKNTRARSYLEEYKNSECTTPREFIIKNYSHYLYARNILKGIDL